MNEQTMKLVDQLAQKLGTTSNYLWSILLKQAPVSAIIDLIYFILTIIGGIILYKVHKYLASEKNGEESIYDENGGFVICIMIFATLIWTVLFIACFFSIGNIINGFFNPEYWAFDKILSSLKS